VSFFDFNCLLLFWRRPTAFHLAPEAGDESRSNRFLSTRGLPCHLPVSNLSFRASGPLNFMKIPGRQGTSKAGDRGIYASLEQKPQAVHLKRHG
jgi:hypothetical protein